MITEKEKRQVLLAEWKQKQAEQEHEHKLRKKVIRRTQQLRMEIYEDECNRSEDDD